MLLLDIDDGQATFVAFSGTDDYVFHGVGKLLLHGAMLVALAVTQDGNWRLGQTSCAHSDAWVSASDLILACWIYAAMRVASYAILISCSASGTIYLGATEGIRNKLRASCAPLRLRHWSEAASSNPGIARRWVPVVLKINSLLNVGALGLWVIVTQCYFKYDASCEDSVSMEAVLVSFVALTAIVVARVMHWTVLAILFSIWTSFAVKLSGNMSKEGAFIKKLMTKLTLQAGFSINTNHMTCFLIQADVTITDLVYSATRMVWIRKLASKARRQYLHDLQNASFLATEDEGLFTARVSSLPFRAQQADAAYEIREADAHLTGTHTIMICSYNSTSNPSPNPDPYTRR